jgi:hypothetical protein
VLLCLDLNKNGITTFHIVCLFVFGFIYYLFKSIVIDLLLQHPYIEYIVELNIQDNIVYGKAKKYFNKK